MSLSLHLIATIGLMFRPTIAVGKEIPEREWEAQSLPTGEDEPD